MGRIIPFLTALMVAMCSMSPSLSAATPECVMLKFADDTRFDKLNTAATLSENVFINLMNSDKFNFSVAEPIDVDLEARLYNNNIRGYETMVEAFDDNDFDSVFDDFVNDGSANSIATAQVGQIVSPSITSKIGRDNGADYLIYGTIINIGVGNWLKEDYSAMSRAINMASTFTGMPASTSLTGMSGPMGNLTSIDVKKTGIGVQCDVKLIKAATGEIVWNKRVLGLATQKMIETGVGQFGRKNLRDALRTKAVDDAAKKIVAALIADLDAGKLF